MRKILLGFMILVGASGPVFMFFAAAHPQFVFTHRPAIMIVGGLLIVFILCAARGLS